MNDAGDTMTDLSSGEQADVTDLGSDGDHNAYSGTGESLQGMSGDGALLVLDDGSVWSVDAGDQATSEVWTDGDSITVSASGDELVDTDQQESVSAGYVGTP